MRAQNQQVNQFGLIPFLLLQKQSLESVSNLAPCNRLLKGLHAAAVPPDFTRTHQQG